MLSKEQIRDTFELLELPLERASEGSPIYIECPYRSKHTQKTRLKDTRLYFDEYPHIWCFHSHCEEDRKELNYTLRVAILGTGSFPQDGKVSFSFSSFPAPESIEFARQVAQDREKIIHKFRKNIRPLARVPINSVEFLARLFSPDDILWIGREMDSGSPRARIHFRTLTRWQKTPPPKGWCFTTGCVFRTGSISRCAASVLERRYLILESDELSLEETQALFEWVEYSLDLRLRAVVFSGKRSLHGWFEYPGDEWLFSFKDTLKAAGFCPGPLSSSQPVRLGNATRENGEEQSILWM